LNLDPIGFRVARETLRLGNREIGAVVAIEIDGDSIVLKKVLRESQFGVTRVWRGKSLRESGKRHEQCRCDGDCVNYTSPETHQATLIDQP
jgi:hypothetical protein